MKSPRSAPAWRRGDVRRLRVVVAVAGLVCSYAAGYHRLSRRSLREGRDYGLDGILDVPVAAAFPADPRDPGRWPAIRRHYALALFFAPIHRLDRLLFGTPPPVTCFMTLSG